MKKRRSFLNALEISEDAISGEVRLSMINFRKIIIENYKSLVEYEEDRIRINTGDKLVKIDGVNFDITNLSDDSLEIEGDISALYFE